EIVGLDGGYKVFKPFDSCRLRLIFDTSVKMDPAEINIYIQDSQGRTCVHLRSDFDGYLPVFERGKHIMEVEIESLNLETNIYFLWSRIVARNHLLFVDSESIPLEVRADWDRHENSQSVVAVSR